MPKLAHVVLETPRLNEMRDFYRTVLDADVVFENRVSVFLRFDEEHHRIALIRVRPDDVLRTREKLSHISFSLPTFQALLDNHDRLAALDIHPYRAMNHGPTTSLYYHDPDGNGVETQVDNSTSLEWLYGWFKREEFLKNPVGVEIDLEDLRRRFQAGEPLETLLLRSDVVAAQ